MVDYIFPIENDNSSAHISAVHRCNWTLVELVGWHHFVAKQIILFFFWSVFDFFLFFTLNRPDYFNLISCTEKPELTRKLNGDFAEQPKECVAIFSRAPSSSPNTFSISFNALTH